MKNKSIKAFCLLQAVIFTISINIAFADTSQTGNYDIQSAVRMGLSNSILLKQLNNKVILNDLKVDAYDKIGDDLIDGETDLSSGVTKIKSSITSIDTYQDAINQAKIDILNGKLPAGSADVVIVANALIIKAGDDISQKIKDFNTATGAGLDVTEITAQITKAAKVKISENQKLLDKNKTTYEEGLMTLDDGKIDYKIAKASIASTLADKLDISELNGLSDASQAELLGKMTRAAAKITLASKGIYKNQIALSIENDYYNVLKAKKLMEVKKATMQRGESQYQFAKDGYEAGMKAKDDMLLANIYYTGTTLEYIKAESDYENSFIELKKNMNISMDKDIELEDVTSDTENEIQLNDGLKQGLTNRLEIIKADQQKEIYKLDLQLVQDEYLEESDQYTESAYLSDNAVLELEKVKEEVESSIRQSYNTMATMKSLLDTAADMVSQAKECRDIAQEKYNEGFVADSSLLKKLNIESAAGTVLEVLSAEENLAQVEEKYIELLYGYNLSKAKYLNDIAYLTY